MTIGSGPPVKEVRLTAADRAALLAALLGACAGDAEAVNTDEESLRNASKDMSFHTPHQPLAVVRPSTPEQVAAVVRTCAAARVSMVPRGAGSGLEGGAIPYGGGVVISTERLRKIDLRKDEMMAVVGAGIHKDELSKFLAPHGLLFGPDPSSNPSIGGMASTGGSGMTTWRYGTTKENVVCLTVVTPHGELIETRKAVRKSSSGYELTQLYMGAEGTLGIICELTVRLRKKPLMRSGGLLPFAAVKAAVDTVAAAVQLDPPSMLRCELLNADGVEATNKMFKTTLPECPTLFLEMAGTDPDALRRDFDSVAAIAAKHGCTTGTQYAANGEDLDEIWEARRGCYVAGIRYRGVKGGDKVFISDVCVPIPKLAESVAAAEDDCREANLKCVICAHIADGNFHCLVPHQAEELERVMEFERRIIDRTLALGGTVTGEHGVGVGKVAHSCREHGAAHIAVQQSIKRALDPLGLMNPGKVLPWLPQDGTCPPCPRL